MIAWDIEIGADILPGSRIPDNVFIAWVIIAIIQSTYNATWASYMHCKCTLDS
jgi:hypothetical protein